MAQNCSELEKMDVFLSTIGRQIYLKIQEKQSILKDFEQNMPELCPFLGIIGNILRISGIIGP